MAITDAFKNPWKLFRSTPNTVSFPQGIGSGSSSPRHKSTTYSFNTSSLSKVVFNRIATDAAMVSVNHVRINSADSTQEIVDSTLQDIFHLEANVDQSSFNFFHDLFYSCMDEGAVAVVPIETDNEPNKNGNYDIYNMRVGKIVQWFPQHVQVRMYNDIRGEEEDVLLEKRTVAIIENPFYEVVNSSSSTLNRLKRKMQALDSLDEEISSGKFNLIFQLPYEIRGEAHKQRARERLSAIENQLKDNKYGIAYTGSSEKVIQLNRPIDNDLSDQVKHLQEEFFNQLGLTENIFNGTASEAEMNNYYARAIDPMMTVLVQEFRRKFLTKTARSQGQDITYNRDVFKLVPISTLAEIADKMSRNEILTPNELRNIMGFRSSKDPKANELSNRNIANKNQQVDPEDPYYSQDPRGNNTGGEA